MRIKQWWHSWLIAADATKSYSERILRAPISQRMPLQLNSLEKRILYSATPMDPAILAETQEIATPVVEHDHSNTTDTIVDATTAATVAQTPPSEIVIIDSRVPDIEQLLDDLERSDKNLEIMVLDRNLDGIEQITDLLDSKANLSALHIVSHAETGAIQLGNLWLNHANMDGYAGSIASWQHSFQSDADILLYGCDLADSGEGQTLLSAIASLTEADVAASSDDTGHTIHGGDWILEHEIGSIEHATIFSEEFQQSWAKKLTVQIIDDFDDSITPSLGITSIREAINIVNSEGTGTLELLAGTYNLTIGGTNEDMNTAGDFDIESDIHITGAGIDVTIIDANDVDRIFDIIGNVTVTIEDLTLRNGDSSDGDGGAIRNTSGVLNLKNVRFESNTGFNGGALANAGTAVLRGVTIDDNVANSVGGGIHQTGLGTIHILETTLNNNSAGTTGGGLHNEGTQATIQRSTLSNNESVGGLGGAIYNAASDESVFTNATFSGNLASQGAAIFTESAVSITNATIVNNSGTGAISVEYGGSVAIKNSILLQNNGNNTNQKLNSLGFNIEDGANAFNPNTGDQQNAILFHTTLGDLSGNGGPTETHALLLGNAAIDAGTNDSAPNWDQRNVTRDSNVDIGAYEFVPSSPSATVEISANSLSGSNNSTPVTITFSEAPLNFDPLEDLTVVGGSLGVATFDVDNVSWIANYTANAGYSGVGSVTLIPDSYTNADLDAGSGDSDTVLIDTTNPTATVEITDSALSDSNNSTAVTITFSEVPAGFDPADDLTVVGGSLSTGAFDATGKIWTATYTANDDFDGTGSVSLANNSYKDTALNAGSGDSDSVTIDTENPTATVEITDSALSDSNNSTAVTITFSEVPAGFDPADDLTVVGGSLSTGAFDATGKIWTATYTANDDFDGTGSVSLANNSYKDTALNAGSGDSDVVTIDTENPTATVEITDSALSDSNNSTAVTITFSEVPAGFDPADDLTVVGGSLSTGAFDATSKIWTATYTANDDFDGTGSVSLANNSYKDTALNAGSGDSDSVTIDTENPTATVEITDSALSDSNNSTAVTITFSEVPAGFDPADDLTVVGGSLSTGAFDATGKIWTATYTANDDFDGTGSVSLANNSYTDTALNAGSGDSDVVSIDTENPTATVEITDSALSDSNNSTAVTITFSEVPAGFDPADDLTVVGGSLSTGAFDATGKIWTATYTANDDFDGTGSISLANNSYTNAALNAGSGDSDSVSIDTENPTATVEITDSALSDSNNSTAVTITFSEVPAGFDPADDLTVVGGSLSTGAFDATGKIWTATYTANDDFDGTGSVSLANNSYKDTALNAGSGDSDSVTIDTENPTATVEITDSALSDSNNSTAVTITFSEVPAGFDPADDLTVVGGSLSTGAFDATGKIWTATYTANDDFDGTGSISLANNSYTNAALNAGSGDSDSVSIDTENPTATVEITDSALSDSNNSTAVTITFSEVPAGFDPADDLTVVGGSLSTGAFDATGKIWTATYTANDDFDGTGSISLANNSYTNAALNAGSGDSDSVSIDTENPTATVEITDSALSDSNNSTAVTITFSEVPAGFDPADDLTVVGGSLSTGAFDATGKIWTATYTANDDFDGTGSVSLANNSYKDTALNAGSGDSDSVTIDTENPTATVEITDSALSDSNNSTAVTITFSEVPAGFDPADDLTVVGGSLSTGAFDATGKIWTATYTANDDFDGTGSVSLANNSYKDTALNAGSGDSDSVTIDTENPTATVEITDSALSDSNNSTAVTITFSEVPAGFDPADDLTVVGGSLSTGAFDATSKIWTATYTANDDFDGTGSISLANNSYTDTALNVGSGDSNTTLINTITPTAAVEISEPSLSDTVNTSTITITFTEPPAGFDPADDLTVVGGSLSTGAFDATGKIWTATYTANDDFDGTGSISLANNSYTNAALNAGSGDSDSVTIDTENPTAVVEITDSALSDSNNSTAVTIKFSEVPAGFDPADDLTVVGGSLSTGAFDATSKIWTATYTANDNFSGTGSVTLANNSFTDAALNAGSGDSDSVTIDTENPTAVIEITDSSLSDSNNSTAVTITFSEVPAGFDPADDLTVVGGSLSTGAFDATGKIWTATYTANVDFTGNGSITLLANSYTDTSTNLGNGNSGSITVDTLAPTVTVNALDTSNPSPSLSGTINDPDANITLMVDGQIVQAANHGDGTWSVIANTLTPLSTGLYDIYVQATDPSDNTGVDNTSNELNISIPAPTPTITPLTTSDTSPGLSGTINDSQTGVAIEVAGQTIIATNNGDGTWTVADNVISALAEGVYDVEVQGKNTAGIIGSDSTNNELVIDTTAPIVGVTSKKTSDPTPSLNGTVNDPTAAIAVTVNGTTLPATNNGNGTWQIMDNQLPILAGGTYDVFVSATDIAGNGSNDNTIDELIINPTSTSLLLNALSANSASGTTVAIIAETGKPTMDAPTVVVDSTSTPTEAISDGESTEDSTENLTSSPQTLVGTPQKAVNTSLQAAFVNQALNLPGLGESRVARSIFTLSEAFESKEVYRTVERTELRIRNSIPRQFDGTTIDTLSRIQAIDSALISQHGALWSQLDTQRDHMESQIHGDLIIVGAAGAAASGFTVGFIAWAFRAGFLASGLLAQLPAWKAIDPTLIMQGFEGFTATIGEDQDTETLEQMMDRQSQAFKTN